ncbi:MAG: acylphosphatase [Thermoguttaceae bacterium]
MSETGAQQQEVLFSGDVQGVGFRYTARSIARGFDVTGFVRNLSDGRVQVVVEGTQAELRAFLGALRQEMRHHISSEEEVSRSASGRFRGFEVRF